MEFDFSDKRGNNGPMPAVRTPSPKPRSPSPRRLNYRRLAALSSLGLMLPSSIAVGLFIGYLLDKFLGTHPWLLAAFTLLGVASGFISLIRGLNKFGVEKDKEDENND